MQTFTKVVLALALIIPLKAVVLVPGNPTGATGTISSGSRLLKISDINAVQKGQQIAIAGVSGIKNVVSILADAVTLDSAADATIFNAPLSTVVDSVEHSSLRVLWTTDVPTYGSVSFGLQAGVYPYRTYENPIAQQQNRLSIGGLKPNTTYHLRINAKPSPGSNVTDICNTESCGSIDLVVTTTPEPAIHPEAPAAPQTFSTAGVDTSVYSVFPVPAFSDGVKTGTISSGSNILLVNDSSGMLPNHWIIIQGAPCFNLWTPPGMPAYPGCQIQSVTDNTVTLTSPASRGADGAAVNWSLYTVQNFLDPSTPYHLGYGTVFEWAQGYHAQWLPIQESYGSLGLKIPGLPPDYNPACANQPCDMDDPAHRWVVFRTAREPGLLPPPGVRITPEWAPNLGGIVATVPNITGNPGEALWGGDGSYSLPPHHFRFENLEFTHSADASLYPPDATDPRPFNELITLSASAGVDPQWIIFDRVYIHGQPAPARLNGGIRLDGRHNALLNSYIAQVDYWRPYSPITTACSTSGQALSIPLARYQRNRSENSWNMKAQVSASLTATAGYTGSFLVFLSADGSIGINYSSARSGQSAAISCGPNCTATELDNVSADLKAPASWQPNTVKYCSGKISNGAFSLSNSLYPDSPFVTEGSFGVSIGDGAGPYNITNNFVEAYGIGFFIDSSARHTAIPSDTVFSRNYMFWNQDHRASSPQTNGYVYQVRNLWEIKRGKRWLLDGNIFEGNWARVNQGSSILLSGRPNNSGFRGEGISDISIVNNIVRNGSAAFYCQGISASIDGDPPISKRVLIANNITYGMNAFLYQHNPATPFIGETFRLLFGCQDVVIKHNTIYYPLGPYPNQVVLGASMWSEGLTFRDNIFYLNSANGASGISADATQSSYPYIPALKSAVQYDNTLAAASVRIAATVEPNYSFTNNVIIGGTAGDSNEQQSDLSWLDLVQNYLPHYGVLAAAQRFPYGNTRADREAAVGLTISATLSDLGKKQAGNSLLAGPLDGANIGADVDALQIAQGDIVDLTITAIDDSSATLAFTAPDDSVCWVAWGSSGSPITSYSMTFVPGAGRGRSAVLRGLSSATSYTSRILCSGAPRNLAISFTTL